MTFSGNRIKQKVSFDLRFVGGRGKDPLGDQRLWIELTESRIETNRQGSIDVWATSSVFPCQISRVPPCLYPLSDGGVDIHGGVIGRERPIRCYHYQMRAQGQFLDWSKGEKTFFPLWTPSPSFSPGLPLANHHLPQHNFRWEITGVGMVRKVLWWFDDDQARFFNGVFIY